MTIADRTIAIAMAALRELTVRWYWVWLDNASNQRAIAITSQSRWYKKSVRSTGSTGTASATNKFNRLRRQCAALLLLD
ncbi:MAG TPA: hypothetical protein VLN61_13540 [Pseudolabrys sp.]|nr:hypothetical protein [Pseudolabrys sp.]